jgi:hypothetical protein
LVFFLPFSISKEQTKLTRCTLKRNNTPTCHPYHAHHHRSINVTADRPLFSLFSRVALAAWTAVQAAAVSIFLVIQNTHRGSHGRAGCVEEFSFGIPGKSPLRVSNPSLCPVLSLRAHLTCDLSLFCIYPGLISVT